MLLCIDAFIQRVLEVSLNRVMELLAVILAFGSALTVLEYGAASNTSCLQLGCDSAGTFTQGMYC